jgi:hypothetical protein
LYRSQSGIRGRRPGVAARLPLRFAEIKPEALARLVGWSTMLKALAPRMRCSQCGKKAAEVVAVAKPRPRGMQKNPH